MLIVLHEHEVPDLEQLSRFAHPDELVETELRFPPSRFSLPANIDEDLRARPAWSRLPHLPEVVLIAEAKDAGVGDAGNLAPQPAGFVVGVVHRHEQPLGSDAEPAFPCYPLPGVLDGLRLEVVPEGEVAEHLEKRVVAGRMPHLLQVVVLPAGPHTLLTGDRPRVVSPLEPLEHPLELDHAGVREEQGGVVRRHQGGARYQAVIPGGTSEVVEEQLPNCGGAHAGEYSLPGEATERLAESYLQEWGAVHGGAARVDLLVGPRGTASGARESLSALRGYPGLQGAHTSSTNSFTPGPP